MDRSMNPTKRRFIITVADQTTEWDTIEQAIAWGLPEVRRNIESGVQIQEFRISELREFIWKVNYPLAETLVTPNPA